MRVIAYAYNAALHCLDCAARAGMTVEGACDENGDPVSAVFSDNAADAPGCCDDCLEFIPTALTSDGYEYVADSIGAFLDCGQGVKGVLLEWISHYRHGLPQDLCERMES